MRFLSQNKLLALELPYKEMFDLCVILIGEHNTQNIFPRGGIISGTANLISLDIPRAFFFAEDELGQRDLEARWDSIRNFFTFLERQPPQLSTGSLDPNYQQGLIDGGTLACKLFVVYQVYAIKKGHQRFNTCRFGYRDVENNTCSFCLCYDPVDPNCWIIEIVTNADRILQERKMALFSSSDFIATLAQDATSLNYNRDFINSSRFTGSYRSWQQRLVHAIGLDERFTKVFSTLINSEGSINLAIANTIHASIEDHGNYSAFLARFHSVPLSWWQKNNKLVTSEFLGIIVLAAVGTGMVLNPELMTFITTLIGITSQTFMLLVCTGLALLGIGVIGLIALATKPKTYEITLPRIPELPSTSVVVSSDQALPQDAPSLSFRNPS